MAPAGAAAVALQLAVAELAAAALPRARGPVAGAVQRIIHMTPGPAVDVGVATARSADKALLKTGVVAGSVVVGALRPERRPLALLGLGTGIAAASSEDAATAPTLAAGAAGTVAGRGALDVLGRRPTAGRVATAGAFAGAIGAAAVALDRRRLNRLDARRREVPLPGAAAPPADAGLPIDAISPLFTPARSFYVTDVNARPPRIDPDAWRLRIGGMVERELELSLDDLAALGLIELDATLVCVHNPVGGDRVGSARWAGVPLADLLERAGAQRDAEQLLARSVDGFTAGVPVEHVRSGAPALLAIGMNGEPLPFEHGFPARLIVPGLWGADANTKWLTALELTTWGAARDYWDRRGWPRQPSRVQPASRIDVPAARARFDAGPITVAGVTWAPFEGVRGVEVQVDGGPWEPVELSPELAPTMWRQWARTWEATPGDHLLRVRALGRRRTQPGGAEPPFPVGVRGYHERRISVAAPAARRRSASRPVSAAADDVRDRLLLAARGVASWRARGFPPPPRFPAPARGGK